MSKMTPEQYVNYNINTYPSLYVMPTRKLSELRILDQTFNTIGNGIDNIDGFLKDIDTKRAGTSDYTSVLEKYNGEHDLFYAYTELETHEYGGIEVTFPKHDSSLDGVFTREEVANMPEAKHMTPAYKTADKEDHAFNPYPNFEKKYSIVWDGDINELDDEWIDAAIGFYKDCKDFFLSEDSNRYHYAFPKANKRVEDHIRDQEKFFEKYKESSSSVEEFHAKVSENWETPYDGDTYKFLELRWANEKERILEFIDETIDMLENRFTPKPR